MRKTILLISMILLIMSCNDNSKKETELIQKENELLKKELELKEKSQKLADKNPMKKIDVKRETQKLFDKYAPQIENSNGAKIGNSDFLIGDLNDDGLNDALVFFILNPKEGGNMILGSEMAIYLNKGDRMEVVAGYNPKKPFKPIEINKNKIHLIEYEYAEGDYPNRPSIERHKYLILNGNELTESRVYK